MKTYKFWGWEQANISPVTEEYPKIHFSKEEKRLRYEYLKVALKENRG